MVLSGSDEDCYKRGDLVTRVLAVQFGQGLTSFFLLEMFFSIFFTAEADSDSKRLTLAPDVEESCTASAAH